MFDTQIRGFHREKIKLKSKAIKFYRCRYISDTTNQSIHSMEVPWKMCNALRLTTEFEIYSWNQRHFYRKNDIVYFTGKSEIDAEGMQMMHVCFWEKHCTKSSDIPREFWVIADWLERAADVEDREVCNFRIKANFNDNTKKRLALANKKQDET